MSLWSHYVPIPHSCPFSETEEIISGRQKIGVRTVLQKAEGLACGQLLAVGKLCSDSISSICEMENNDNTSLIELLQGSAINVFKVLRGT